MPYYQTGTTTLIGIATVDYDYTVFQKLLSTYKTNDVDVYLVETKTFRLIASSTGTNPVVNNVMTNASDSINPLISGSATYLTNSDTKWRNDGDYSVTISGLPYAINLMSFADNTLTLNWKIVTFSQRSGSGSSYVPTPQECLIASVDEIRRVWSIATTVVKQNAFHHGANPYQPLETSIMEKNPPFTGITQQTAWLMDRSASKNYGITFVRYN